jgi:FKBP-type peptidyl-prolyl cis-trans isomerase FklB
MIYALSKGDSAILKVPLTNEEKINELKNSDTLKFFVKVIDIMDEEKVLKYLSDNFKDETQQNQRYVPEYDEIRRLLFKKLKDLKGIRNRKETYFTPYGIEYFVLQSGGGEKIGKGSKVSFDYIGLKNPEFQEFDNSYLKTQDVEIVVGEKMEIAAWDDALSVMNKDMVAVFFIPSEKAYGKAGKPGVVQPNTDLIYLMKVNKIIK